MRLAVQTELVMRFYQCQSLGLEASEPQSVISGRYQQRGSQKVGFEVGKRSAEGDGGLMLLPLKTTWQTKEQKNKNKTITSLNVWYVSQLCCIL